MDDQSKPDPEQNADGTPRPGNGPAETAGASPERQHEPGSEATQLVTPEPVRDQDATELVAPDLDATKVVTHDSDATRIVASGETTVLRPQTPDATSIMPSGAGRPPAAPPGERWSGKANVPLSRPPQDPDATAMWQPPEPGRVWWLPILLAIIGLILVIGIAYAVVTALNNGSDSTPAPAPPASSANAPSQTPPSSTFSSPPPTTPTSAPPTTPTAAGTFTVPSTLIGLPITDAETILDSYGIAYTAVAQADNVSLPNTVVNTTPAQGQLVPDGGTVILYYAQPLAPSSPPTPTPSVSTSS